MRIGTILAAALALVLAGAAHAQTRKPQITGDIVADTKANLGAAKNAATGTIDLSPDAVIKKIMAMAAPDLTYAIALATSSGTNSAKVRLQCLNAINDFRNQVSGNNLPKDSAGNPLPEPSEPHVFTDLEKIAEGIDDLSPTGPLFTGCSGVAGMLRMQVIEAINAVIGGTAAAALVVPK